MVRITLAIIIYVFSFFNSNVYAQGFCDFYPCGNGNSEGEIASEETLLSSMSNVFQTVTSALFAIIILYGVYLVIKGAVEIIRSEGDAEKVEKGYKLIKSVYIGVAMIFIGLIGLVIIAALFGGVSIFQVQIKEPESFDTPFL
jgi:hypothetical protein